MPRPYAKMVRMNLYLPPTIDPQALVATIGLISDTHMPQRWAKLPPFSTNLP